MLAIFWGITLYDNQSKRETHILANEQCDVFRWVRHFFAFIYDAAAFSDFF